MKIKFKKPDEIVLNIANLVMEKSFNIGTPSEEPVEGVLEHRDIEYTNRVGKKLTMDIFEPEFLAKGEEMPVVINIHGGGLIGGAKEYSRRFCRKFAKKGYLVCSLEYRIVPNVRVYEQFDDVCAGMDCVGRKLIDFDVDITRIYITAESAGAYLAMYVAAMIKSEALQKAIGYAPTRLRFKAMGLMSGMFYTARRDKVGIFLAPHFYGNDKKSREMARYTNPEDPEIIYNIPPVYLITSKADMVERYTLDLAGELGNKGIEHKLRHMGSDKKLIHAFPVLCPDYPESDRVIDEIDAWFKEHA